MLLCFRCLSRVCFHCLSGSLIATLIVSFRLCLNRGLGLFILLCFILSNNATNTLTTFYTIYWMVGLNANIAKKLFFKVGIIAGSLGRERSDQPHTIQNAPKMVGT